MQYIAFDLETTGFLPGVDQIVEIGAIKFDAGEPIAKFSTLVNPGRPMPEAASKVNGITDDMLTDQPSIDEILESFCEFCSDTTMVAHNAGFDFQFLLADAKKHEIPAAKGIVLDTLSMSRKILPGLPNYKLGTLIKHLNIPSGNFHRAEEDAGYAGLLFWKLIQRIYKDNEVPSIENLIALSNNQALRFPLIEKKPKQLGLF